MNKQKFLDENGLKFLWNQLSLQDYPNNETLVAIINAIDEVKISKTDLLDLIYPVGAIYLALNSTPPATLFGGTWIQIKDTFLLAAGDNYSAGATGGSATYTLSKEQTPFYTTYDEGKMDYGLSQTAGFKNRVIVTADSTAQQSINNMPPYLVVYIWQRIE